MHRPILFNVSTSLAYILCFAPLALAANNKASAVSKTSCCCSVSISGNYRFFVQPAGGASTGPFTGILSTSGCTFKSTEATSNGHRIYGTITGNQVNFSEVVDGEEAEGFVRQVRGFARKTSGGGSIIAGVYTDTDGVTGSWTASKLP